MPGQPLFIAGIAALATVVSLAQTTSAMAFDWKKWSGQTVHFLVNNNPIGNALLKHKSQFEDLTGIKLVADQYQEQQMRQRLLTAMNARSTEFDIFMTLPSLEGKQFAAAGWYEDLGKYAASAPQSYDYKGLSKALLTAATYDGHLTSLPINVDGPVLYYRKDILTECGQTIPAKINGLPTLFSKLKACKSAIVPFASRGLKAAAPYTFSAFLHNMGGEYRKDGKPQLCSTADKEALRMYTDILRKYGPPGVINANFYQVADLFRSGRAAMAFESVNQLEYILKNPQRQKDTAVTLLPPGKGGSVPTVIGWGLAMSPYSGKKGPAWYFLQWATSPKTQNEIALDGVAVPRASVSKSPEFQALTSKFPARKERQAALEEMLSTGSSEVGVPIIANRESREYIGSAIGDLILGQGTVETACKKADASIEALIKQER